MGGENGDVAPFVRSPAGRRFSSIVGANTVRPRKTNALPYKFVRWRFVCRGYYSPTNYVGPPSWGGTTVEHSLHNRRNFL